MTALIYGASGLIGSYLLEILLNSSEFDKVTVVVRKELSIQHDNLVQLVTDFDKLRYYQDSLSADHVFCAIGTTKKKTPNKAEYYRIDHDYPLLAAAIALENNAKSFHLVSAIGADPKSNIFYSKTKGELEEEVKMLPFPSLHIYRPSLLTGKRNEKRSMEELSSSIMKIIDPILIGNLKKYQSIPAELVALAMYKEAISPSKGTFLHLSDEIKDN